MTRHLPASDTRPDADAHTHPLCTVVVLTRNRRHFLYQALASLGRQSFRHMVVMVVNNGRPLAEKYLKAPLCGIPLRYCHLPGDRLESLPVIARVAHLRNLAIRLLNTPLVAFLDDDNRWDEHHLKSLVQALERGYDAAHSWRRLVDCEGAPVPLTHFPWASTHRERARRFTKAERAGLVHRGSDIIRDQVAAFDGVDDVGMVDMGAWLLPTKLLGQRPFVTTYSDRDLFDRTGEDDKFLEYVKSKQLAVFCTRQPTLVYTLGGFSNA